MLPPRCRAPRAPVWRGLRRRRHDCTDPPRPRQARGRSHRPPTPWCPIARHPLPEKVSWQLIQSPSVRLADLLDAPQVLVGPKIVGAELVVEHEKVAHAASLQFSGRGTAQPERRWCVKDFRRLCQRVPLALPIPALQFQAYLALVRRRFNQYAVGHFCQIDFDIHTGLDRFAGAPKRERRIVERIRNRPGEGIGGQTPAWLAWHL